jgi:hypothetical protein
MLLHRFNKGFDILTHVTRLHPSRNADADRALLRDLLKLGHVDVGSGWLIFGLPPSEVALHPTEGPEGHELYLSD